VSASASIGIATSRNGEDQPDDVLRNADIAMYRAKSLGKQRYALFSPELLGSAVQRLELETDLARALERHEFFLLYQPLVAMQSGCLIGFEALVRWRHPGRGLVNPNDFIPLAEETGAIIPLGAWILHEACRQLKEWQSTLPGAADLRMNINVSGKQFASPEFLATVESALATSGLRAESISLEITESVMLHNADDARQTLSRIRNLGIQIHLDDFGTGYSSLSYLRDFPVDALKIDRSFVSTAEDEATAGLASADIVRSIIALAGSMSLSVTAEGVETAAQVEALRDLGCTNMQGFHFSRPVEAAAAASMISTKSLASAARGTVSPFPAEPIATQ
jgi:EAL domain-containing protein (putative c-di-GMP-specific phosphodiesterase class I)